MSDRLYTWLPYQWAWIQDHSPVKVWAKSRRIGASFCDAGDSASIAALSRSQGGMSTYYLSYNKDMTRQYVRDVASFAQKFHFVASAVEEIVLDRENDVTMHQVTFASGHVVQGLSSNPANLRSKQGRVRIDEAAFVDDLPALLKAALALTMWGGDVALMSTHNGEDNAFNQLVQEIRAGKLPYSLHRTTLDDALQQGLFRRIVEVKGEVAAAQGQPVPVWSQEAEDEWRAKLIEEYGVGAPEELFCIPSRSSGTWLTRNLIENCMASEIPVLRWTPPAGDFVDWPLERAAAEVRDWCEAELEPLLRGLDRDARSFLGEDFGRSGDLTVLWPLQELAGLFLSTPFVVELRDAPFRTQEQILAFLGDRLPRFSGAALDARGNGQALAEFARQRFGAWRVAEVMLSEPWYREHMPKLKSQLEDRSISVPKDTHILDDLRTFRMVKGVAKLPDVRTSDAGGNRHGDAGIALALAIYAAKTSEAGPVEHETVIPRRFAGHAGAY